MQQSKAENKLINYCVQFRAAKIMGDRVSAGRGIDLTSVNILRGTCLGEVWRWFWLFHPEGWALNNWYNKTASLINLRSYRQHAWRIFFSFCQDPKTQLVFFFSILGLVDSGFVLDSECKWIWYCVVRFAAWHWVHGTCLSHHSEWHRARHRLDHCRDLREWSGW